MYMRTLLNRENCLSEYIIDGVKQFDISENGMKDYDFGDYTWTTIKHNEAQRPDLLSNRIYGSDEYWWVVMQLNGFADAWNDIQPNTAVKVYNSERIKSYIQYRKKRVSRTD